MKAEYQNLLADVRDAYARSTETALALARAQEACAVAAARTAAAVQALTRYVESLEVQIEDPPS